MLKVGQPNRVRFDDGGTGPLWLCRHAGGLHPRFRARPGPRRTASRTINRRVYLPAAPELDGKVLPVGFGVAVNATYFENLASQVALGGKARVALTAWRNIPDTTPEWERDFLIVEEHLPAGATLIEGSVQTSATSYHLADGVLTFYFAPNQNPGVITYDVHGYLPGQYRALPDFDPERLRAGPIPSRAGERPARAGAGRAEHRSLQADPRRALCPRESPLRRRPVCRGGRSARAALRRLHAPRRRRQGRGPHAAS